MARRQQLRWAARVAAGIVTCVLAATAGASAHTISGTVTAAVGGGAVGDAELQLWYWDQADQAWYRKGVYAASGADGTYALSFYDDGEYRVQCYNTPGYADQWWDHVATADLATSLVVPGATLTGIDFALAATKAGANLTLAAPAVSAYKAVTLTGFLTDAGGGELPGETVTIRAATTGSFADIGSAITDGAGEYSFAATPGVKTTYQAVFAENAVFAGAASGLAQVLPRVYLTRPTGPSQAHATTIFTSVSDLMPRHPPGTFPVYIECQRYESGNWVTKKKVKAKAVTYLTKYSRCSARIQLGAAGSWRIRAVHAQDASNAATASTWRSITVY